jgi:hypothetical protein
VMLVGIGFLSVLTATVASEFVKTESSHETDEILSRWMQPASRASDEQTQPRTESG